MEDLLTPRTEPVRGATGPQHQLVEHLDAAYNLARWLLRNETEAEDAVQEAYLRAFSHFHSFRGGDGRAWLLTIVRNRCYDRLKQSKIVSRAVLEDQSCISGELLDAESALLNQETTQRVRRALENLPPQLREVLVLRELEEMSYSQIAAALETPVGTVMSRLSRARQRLQEVYLGESGGEKRDEFIHIKNPVNKRQ